MPWDQRIASGFVEPFVRLGVTPNQVTAASLMLGLLGAALYGWGVGFAPHVGAAIFALSTVLDHADGQLARRTGTSSRFGHYFDHVAGAISYVGLFIGIGVGLRHGDLAGWAILMGAAAGICVTGIFGMRMYMERRRPSGYLDQPSFAGFEIEDVLYLVVPITWFGWLEPFLVVACIGAPVFAAWQILDYLRGRTAVERGE